MKVFWIAGGKKHPELGQGVYWKDTGKSQKYLEAGKKLSGHRRPWDCDIGTRVLYLLWLNDSPPYSLKIGSVGSQPWLGSQAQHSLLASSSMFLTVSERVPDRLWAKVVNQEVWTSVVFIILCPSLIKNATSFFLVSSVQFSSVAQ